MFKWTRRCCRRIERLECRRLLAGDSGGVELELYVRDSYLPNIPFLVRAQVEDADGSIDRSEWDQVVGISSDNPNVSLSQSEIKLTNGLGSALVSATGNDDFSITATLGDQTISQVMKSISEATVETVGGPLEGDNPSWSGIVRVESDVLVGENQTLTIEPGTLVLVDGVPVTENESIGTKIEVKGTLNAIGTSTSPITFTAFNADEPWGELRIEGGIVALKNTNLTRAGNSDRGGHTATGPAIRLDGGLIELESANVTDIRGKIMQATSGDVIVLDSLFSRAVMGPEIDNTALKMDRSWITDMAGVYHYDGKVDDNDSIYMHSQLEGQEIAITNSVIARSQDDGLDTLGANASFSNLIIRDVDDKGVSILRGTTKLDRILIANADIGINAKGTGQNVVDVFVSRTTIANVNTGIRAQDKDLPDPDVTINFHIEDSIIHVNSGGNVVETDYDPAEIKINYSLLPREWNHFGSGQGNLVADPLFVNSRNNRFDLSQDSPAIDAGNPDSLPDPDGTRTDMGAFFYDQSAAILGDFNSDNKVDATDIDQLCSAIQESQFDDLYDLNDDQMLSQLDLEVLVEDILHTTFGDSNMDGRFDSSDLVAVFQAGEYEDGILANSTWATGDWNCDGEFSTNDLVLAFQRGSYTTG